MYEQRSERPIPTRRFVKRLVGHFALTLGFVAVSLAAGMAGYMWFAGMTVIDAFLNASMLLGGMGPVGDLPNDASKVFAGAFALYAGLVFVISAGLLLAPIVHRLLHKLHADERDAR